jgi:hypothetical protein
MPQVLLFVAFSRPSKLPENAVSAPVLSEKEGRFAGRFFRPFSEPCATTAFLAHPAKAYFVS